MLIDEETGLLEYSLSLCHLVMQLDIFHSSSVLVSLSKRMELLQYSNEQKYQISDGMELFTDDEEMTISNWRVLSSSEIIHSILQVLHDDYDSFIQYITKKQLLSDKEIMEYLDQSMKEKSPSFLLCWISFIENNRLDLMLKGELEEFTSFFIRHLKNPEYEFTVENLESLQACSVRILQHPLLSSTFSQQIQLLSHYLEVTRTLQPIVSVSLIQMEKILSEEEDWCKEHPIDFQTASNEEITAYTSLQSSLLLKQIYIKYHYSFKQLSSIQESCFSYLPSSLLKYLLLPIMLEENTLSSLNSASSLTEQMNHDWLNSIVLLSVNNTILSLNQ